MIALAIFVLWNSANYAAQMFKLGRVSDMANIPMWILHAVVALGFGLIAYGTTAEESVPRLYAAGVVPGVMLALMPAVYVIWFARRHGIDGSTAFKLKNFMHAAWRGIWALGMPLIMLGGRLGPCRVRHAFYFPRARLARHLTRPSA
jgi:hypothetical protein